MSLHVPIPLARTLAIVLLALSAPAQTVIRVDDSATGAQNGTTWADAYTDLGAAMLAATHGEELWVAEGTYRPTVERVPGDPRSATFLLAQWGKLYGGFAGNEATRAQRAGRFATTILTGELQGNGDLADNAYHVVTTWGLAVLDGFTIEGGNTLGGAEGGGGGILCTVGGNNHLAELTLSNCTLRRNTGWSGGAYFQSGGSVLMERNQFLRNTAANGGAVRVSGAAFRAYDCVFAYNLGTVQGGGISIGSAGAGPILAVNSLFHHNAAPLGGGVFVGDGALWNGAGTFSSCTFTLNSAERGGGLYAQNASASPATMLLQNSIVWGNLAALSGPELEGQSTLQFCDAPGGTGFSIYADPLFVPGTFRLSANSPCRDRGNQHLVPEDVADLDDDGDTVERVPLDFGGDPRVLDLNVDLGYEEFGPNG